jgi:ABC transport system ATP-binding/permease protein
MALIGLSDVSISFGLTPLLNGVNLTVASGERIGLLGRNGTGKSTLLGIIAGELPPDSGDVKRAQGVRLSGLAQGIPEDLHGTVMDVICQAMGLEGADPAARITSGAGPGVDDSRIGPRVPQAMADGEAGWQARKQVTRIISQMNLPADGDVGTFSAGMKRQVLLAAALAVQPDLLLLDEPTNHLDVVAIEWLERFLLKWAGTLVLITHDRLLIRRLATRIVEIDRGKLYSWNCGYDAFLQRNQERLEAEAKRDARFDKKLSAEEAWIRQGVKARRTRNEGRVRALDMLRDIRQSRLEPVGKAQMTLEEAERSGKRVIEAANLTFAYGDRVIVKDFSCTILRGDRVGILGPNGAGKSTLIRLLLGAQPLQHGRIRHGTQLAVSYYDQLRGELDENRSVQENIVPDGDQVDVGGKRRHVIGYLKDFLFSPQRSRTPVRVLSGGEKNRLLLAKLFARPANVLVLDEPTNDLDVETLELLEALIMGFSGTVLLVSHDRAFINNVVSRTLVFEGSGRVDAYAGGYDDWLFQRQPRALSRTDPPPSDRPKRAFPPPAGPKKLGYMEKRELDLLPGRIDLLEARRQELFQIMSDPGFYRQAGGRAGAVKEELEQVEHELARAFSRWEDLEGRDSP